MLGAVHTTRPSLLTRRGSGTTPIFVFLGIVGLSVVFFFLFTLPRWTGGEGKPQPPPAVPEKVAAQQPKPGPAAATGTGAAVKPKPKPQKPAIYYASPEGLLQAIQEPLEAGNLEAAFRVAGSRAGQSPQANFLRHILTTAGYRVASGRDTPWTRLGQAGEIQRYTLALSPAEATAPPAAGLPWFDVERSEKQGWEVAAIGFPEALIRQVSELLSLKSVVVDAAEVRTKGDAMSRATEFLSGIISHDFKSARGLTDETKVTHEKLAGLCIVFEEGSYQLVKDRPVRVTSESRDTATALLKVRSDKLAVDSEMGVVLRNIPGRGWTVEDLNFDRMLNSYVKATGAGQVAYTPIVRSPQGGESLVLYFEFDRAAVTERSRRQLEIVAGLLKSDPVRKLRISGHSDAVGNDQYNLQLSQQRALAVASTLRELGVAPGQVVTVGFGATAPLDQNTREDGQDNPEGRSRNRRTEVYLDFGN